MKRSITFILPALFLIYTCALLLACNDAQQKNAETKEATTPVETTPPTATTSVANTLDIKIPESSDPELNDFFKLYTAHLNEYVRAVHENNQAQIKTSFQREKKFRIQLLDMPARLEKAAPAEWEKYENYRSRTNKYMNEIEKSEYVKALHDQS
jgi:hypothetical protein